MSSLVVPTRADEERLWALGHSGVAGVDEVGRGCLAGPLTVAAVILPSECDLSGVRDSKSLTPKQRQQLAVQIKRCARAVGIGWVSSWEIDELGLTAAQRRAGERALSQIKMPYTAIILDGRHNYLGDHIPVSTVIRGDQVCLAVAAAAVVAKVARDSYMELLHRQLPDYGFGRHKGYGSREHLQALQQLGPSIYHRRSYQPVADLTGVG
jgi:ribonuclease HII